MKKIVIQDQPPLNFNIETMIEKLEKEYQKNNQMKMKRKSTFSIEEQTLDMFQVTAAIMQDQPTDIIKGAIKDYIIRHKAEVNDFVKTYYKNENN